MALVNKNWTKIEEMFKIPLSVKIFFFINLSLGLVMVTGNIVNDIEIKFGSIIIKNYVFFLLIPILYLIINGIIKPVLIYISDDSTINKIIKRLVTSISFILTTFNLAFFRIIANYSEGKTILLKWLNITVTRILSKEKFSEIIDLKLNDIIISQNSSKNIYISDSIKLEWYSQWLTTGDLKFSKIDKFLDFKISHFYLEETTSTLSYYYQAICSYPIFGEVFSYFIKAGLVTVIVLLGKAYVSGALMDGINKVLSYIWPGKSSITILAENGEKLASLQAEQTKRQISFGEDLISINNRLGNFITKEFPKTLDAQQAINHSSSEALEMLTRETINQNYMISVFSIVNLIASYKNLGCSIDHDTAFTIMSCLNTVIPDFIQRPSGIGTPLTSLSHRTPEGLNLNLLSLNHILDGMRREFLEISANSGQPIPENLAAGNMQIPKS